MSETERENAKREDVVLYLGALGIKHDNGNGTGRAGRRFECGCFIPSATEIPIEPCDRHRRAIGK